MTRKSSVDSKAEKVLREGLTKELGKETGNDRKVKARLDINQRVNRQK